MINSLRFFWQLSVLSSCLVLAGILLFNSVLEQPPLGHYLVTVLVMTLINLGIYFLGASGQQKAERPGTLRVLAAIILKILLYMLFLLLYWLLIKNVTIAYVLTFFTLYLVFTLFILYHLLKVLNNK